MKLRPTFISKIEEAIVEAEARVRRGENSPHLPRNYRDRQRAYYQPFFGNTPLDKVDTAMIRHFAIWLTNEKGRLLWVDVKLLLGFLTPPSNASEF